MQKRDVSECLSFLMPESLTTEKEFVSYNWGRNALWHGVRLHVGISPVCEIISKACFFNIIRKVDRLLLPDAMYQRHAVAQRQHHLGHAVISKQELIQVVCALTIFTQRLTRKLFTLVHCVVDG